MKILLASMPWATADSPSMQIATLKSFLVRNGLQVDAAHWHIEVALAFGFNAYTRLAEPLMDSVQSVYSYLAFPEMRRGLLAHAALRGRAAEVRRKIGSDHGPLQFAWKPGFFREFEELHQTLLDRYDWNDYTLVGFTLNYAQTVPSLYMAREIKKRNPRCRIIFGGFETSDNLGKTLLEAFPEIDFACNGEGELPLVNLAQALMRNATEEEIRGIRGLICRDAGGKVLVNTPHQIEDMDVLGPPDFDEYFECLERQGIVPHSVLRELPVESSRGCPFSCNFCSVGLQWGGFRSRSPDKVAGDLRELSCKYKTLSFLFVDDILPKNSEEMFSKIAEQGVAYRFFYEIRAQTPPRTLRLMKKAGAIRVQCGIEAFSTSVLKKLNKKSRFIHNLQAMKLCEELGLDYSNNVITNVPGATKEEVEETVRNMEYCQAYKPVSVSPYSLEFGAPDYALWREKGIRAVRNSKVYELFYPPSALETLDLVHKEYDGLSRVSWRPVLKALNRWRRMYRQAKEKLDEGCRSLLEYRDGGSFLQIEDRRGLVDGSSVLHILNEFERGVYLFAREMRPWSAFAAAFRGSEEKVKTLIAYFLNQKLMYAEEGYYLSLAMRSCRDRPSPSRSPRSAEPELQGVMTA